MFPSSATIVAMATTGRATERKRARPVRITEEGQAYDRPEIPLRVLHNSISRVLAEVGRGRSFRVTVRGRPVAEIVPVTTRRTWVPWSEVIEIMRVAPMDKKAAKKFMDDVDSAVDQTLSDPWERWKRS
jgi:prevent-host-death family protein